MMAIIFHLELFGESSVIENDLLTSLTIANRTVHFVPHLRQVMKKRHSYVVSKQRIGQQHTSIGQDSIAMDID